MPSLRDFLGLRPVASHEVGEDARNSAWMQARNIHPSELSVYDWLTAMKDGYEPVPKGQHNVSTYKRGNHEAIVVGGFNTKTGQRVQGAPMAKSVNELIALGWEPSTAKQLWASVGGKP